MLLLSCGETNQLCADRDAQLRGDVALTLGRTKLGAVGRAEDPEQLVRELDRVVQRVLPALRLGLVERLLDRRERGLRRVRRRAELLSPSPGSIRSTASSI